MNTQAEAGAMQVGSLEWMKGSGRNPTQHGKGDGKEEMEMKCMRP